MEGVASDCITIKSVVKTLSGENDKITRMSVAGDSSIQWQVCYHVTLCASALSAVAQCPSVCVRLSITFLYCIQTAKDIVKLLSRPGIAIIMRPSSLGGGRILRRTLSVCPSLRLSVRPSRYRM